MEFLVPDSTLNARGIHPLKLSKSGRIYLDYYSVPLEELGSKLDEIKVQGHTVGYFRESPQTEHNKELAERVMREIIERDIKVGMGRDPFEWGPVTNLLTYKGPSQLFMSASVQDRVLSFSFIPEGKKDRVSTRGELAPGGSFLPNAGVLVSADFIMETPMREPNKELNDELLHIECLYVAIKCEGSPQWASFYERDTAPANVKGFVDDLVWLTFDQFPRLAQLKG